MTHETHTHSGHENHAHNKKKARTKCDQCSHLECTCQSGCCGGACPNCNF